MLDKKGSKPMITEAKYRIIWHNWCIVGDFWSTHYNLCNFLFILFWSNSM